MPIHDDVHAVLDGQFDAIKDLALELRMAGITALAHIEREADDVGLPVLGQRCKCPVIDNFAVPLQPVRTHAPKLHGIASAIAQFTTSNLEFAVLGRKAHSYGCREWSGCLARRGGGAPENCEGAHQTEGNVAYYMKGDCHRSHSYPQVQGSALCQATGYFIGDGKRRGEARRIDAEKVEQPRHPVHIAPLQ